MYRLGLALTFLVHCLPLGSEGCGTSAVSVGQVLKGQRGFFYIGCCRLLFAHRRIVLRYRFKQRVIIAGEGFEVRYLRCEDGRGVCRQCVQRCEVKNKLIDLALSLGNIAGS